MFLAFIAITLWITWWAARRTSGSSGFFAAGRTLKAWQNGIAVAGDYMLTITARPQDGSSKSVDFRITVLTSTLWGVAGIGLIAVAVGVVALAVGRFGRR